jgi:hypothetical protein
MDGPNLSTCTSKFLCSACISNACVSTKEASLVQNNAAGISRNSTEDTRDVHDWSRTSSKESWCSISSLDSFQPETSPRKQHRLISVLRQASKSWCQLELYLEAEQNIVLVRRSHKERHDQHNEEEVSPPPTHSMSPTLTSAMSLTAEGNFKEISSGDVLLSFKGVVVPQIEDVFSCCQRLGPPCLDRQMKALPMFRAILSALQTLHRNSTYHGRIRAENCWLHTQCDGSFEVFFTDFLMGDPGIPCQDAMFSLPETSASNNCFSLDRFACGILGYALALGRYPWTSTLPGSCKAFEYAKSYGINSFLQVSFRRSAGGVIPEYNALLQSLFSFEPEVFAVEV